MQIGDFKFQESFSIPIPWPLALGFIMGRLYRFCALWASKHFPPPLTPEFRNAMGLTGAPCSQLSLQVAQMKARSWLLLNETQLACLPSAGLCWVFAAHWLHRQGGPLTNSNIHVVPKSQASSQLDWFPNLLPHTAKQHLCQHKARGVAGGGRKAELCSWFWVFSCKFEMPGDCQVLW